MDSGIASHVAASIWRPSPVLGQSSRDGTIASRRVATRDHRHRQGWCARRTIGARTEVVFSSLPAQRALLRGTDETQDAAIDALVAFAKDHH
jgi:hypothetical protein